MHVNVIHCTSAE